MPDADATELPARWLQVWTTDGEFILCCAEEEPNLDAAVTGFIDSAGSRDTLCLLTAIGGATHRLLASTVTSWTIQTPATVTRAREINRAIDALGAKWDDA
jgi:hypothetical protein